MTEDESELQQDRQARHARRVVVGIDGSQSSDMVLARAMEEAALRGATLEVVVSWLYPFERAAGTIAMVGSAADMQRWAEEVLDDAVAKVQGDGRVPVVRHVEYGPPIKVLMAQSEGADLLVVGTRGHGRVSGLFLGSVSQYLAVHAPCPVMVVHGRVPAPPTASTAPADLDSEPMLEEIAEDECWALLAGKSLGRLVVVHGDQPLVFPLNYVLDGHTVAVRTDAGTALDWATLGKVAFEVDEVDDARKEGWSVVVHGVGRDVTEGVDAWSERLRAHDELEPWAGGDRRHWIAVTAATVAGRRLRHGRPQDSSSPAAVLS